jgi:hypothetical protein
MKTSIRFTSNEILTAMKYIAATKLDCSSGKVKTHWVQTCNRNEMQIEATIEENSSEYTLTTDNKD